MAPDSELAMNIYSDTAMSSSGTRSSTNTSKMPAHDTTNTLLLDLYNLDTGEFERPKHWLNGRRPSTGVFLDDA